MKLTPSRFADAAQSPAAPIVNELPNHANGTLSASEAVRMGIFGDLPSHRGPAVTDSSAMQVGTVYACLDKLGGAIGQLPLHHYTLDANGDRDRVTPPSPIWWMVNESPTPAWTAFAWKDWIVRCVKLRGDQHTRILRSRSGAVVGLMPLHPDSVRPRRRGDRNVYDWMDPETGTIEGIDQDDILHFTGFGYDGLRSMSAIKWAGRNAIANSLSAASYMGRTLAEGGMPRIALEFPNKLSPDGAKDMRDRFVEIYGQGDGSKLPLVMTEGGKAHELSISPLDLELLAARKFDKGEICEIIGVPPIIIGDSEKTSSWGTGVEQISLGWIRFSIQPLLARWEEELNRKLFRRAGQFLEFNLSALLRGDSKTQAEVFRAALGGPGTGDGWLSVNQVRRLTNEKPISDPEFDKPFRAQRSTERAPAP